MKIIGVVGIRQSGKTTTVEVLVRELKKRGFSVGTVKTINCPLFEIEESEKSNTRRHKMAGADVVCASAKGETTFIYGEGLDQNRIFEKLRVDYLILEGDYQSDVPRIICAHGEEEIPPRMTGQTFLVSGRIADLQEQVCGFPAVSAVKDPEGLAEKVLECAREVKIPVNLLPIPKEAVTFCQHACKKACERARKDIVDKTEAITPRHVFLTGEKQVGKSTVWEKVLEELKAEYSGFRTCPFELNGQRKGYYMHAVGPVPEGYYNDVPIAVRSGDKSVLPVTEAFDTFGASLLRKAITDDKELIVLDELGKLERNASRFQHAVLECLSGKKTVIGVLQKTRNPFIEAIRNRRDVLVYEVTKENRDDLPKELLELVRNLMAKPE